MSSPTSTSIALLMRPESVPARFSFAEEPAHAECRRRGPSLAMRAVRRAVAALVVSQGRAGLPA